MNTEKNDVVEVSNIIRETVMLLKNCMAKGFEGMGITSTQGMVVGNLFKNNQMKVSDLSKELGLSNSTVSGILDRMEKQDLIKRIRSKEDKRVVFVCLTKKVETMHENLHKRSEEIVGEIIALGTGDDVIRIVEGVGILKKLLTMYMQEDKE